MVIDEWGDDLSPVELTNDLTVQTERLLGLQSFSDLDLSQHVLAILADGFVQLVHTTERFRMLRVVIDLFQVVLISRRLIESSSVRSELSTCLLESDFTQGPFAWFRRKV